MDSGAALAEMLGYFRAMGFIVIAEDLDAVRLGRLIAPDVDAGLRFVSDARTNHEYAYSLRVPPGMLAAKIFVHSYRRHCLGDFGEPWGGALLDTNAERRFLQGQFMLRRIRRMRAFGEPLPEANLLDFGRYEESVRQFGDYGRAAEELWG